MDIAKLGSRIKSRREILGLRQSDIARALQISAQAVSKWERGGNAPDIAMLVDLAGLLGVSIEWLLGGTSAHTDTFEATVFCTTLNGFAVRAATMPPREVADWVNSIFSPITEAVMRFDGVPVKYVGDGFLGFFTGARHSGRAVDAALYAKKILDQPDLVVSLNTGEIFLGIIGHPDYSNTDIIGEPVNTAFIAMQWIAEKCAGGIGVTEKVADRAGAERFEECGEAVIRGARNPVKIFEPKGTSDTGVPGQCK